MEDMPKRKTPSPGQVHMMRRLEAQGELFFFQDNSGIHDL
jgi:hypothetical protein